MKELCRICARELSGNQRKWIFHTTTKLNLQVLLSHVLGRELVRDGKGEFACSKCAFMLDRMYRFDTVIARIEALSIERLQKLLLEKDRLRQCILTLYRKNNTDESALENKPMDCTVDISGLPDVKYNALLQDDFAYSSYESWAEHEEQTLELQHHCHVSEVSMHKSRKCCGCSALRVADSDYEAVCKVPRKLARSISCGPSTRYSASVLGSICTEESTVMTPVLEVFPAESNDDGTTVGPDVVQKMSPASSEESLDTTVEIEQTVGKEEEIIKEDQKSESWNDDHLIQHTINGHLSKLDFALTLVKTVEYRPIKSPQGSKLPIMVKPRSVGVSSKRVLYDVSARLPSSTEFPFRFQELVPMQVQQMDLSELDELWEDVCVEYMPFQFKNLIEEQQSQLNQYECAAGQCVSELQKAQLQVQSLQKKVQETEAANKTLQEKLSEMESELRAIRQATQNQERTIEAVTGKSTEVSGEILDTAQLQAQCIVLQNSLFSHQLQLQKTQQVFRKSEHQIEELTGVQNCLRKDLQDAMQERDAAAKYNQELASQLQHIQDELQMKEQQIKDAERTMQAEVQFRDAKIQRLNQALCDKDHLVQEYMEYLEQHSPPEQSSGRRDTLLDKLRARIKERDKALEKSIDEKYRALEEKESEVHQLQLALREKERDQERLRCILSNNEETITSLDSLMKIKDIELEQASLTCSNLQWFKQETEEKHQRCLKDKDVIISQLEMSLKSRTKEVEELTAVLLNKISDGAEEVKRNLHVRLELKERMVEELLTDRNQRMAEHEHDITNLLKSIEARDQQTKNSAEQLKKLIVEKNAEIQELRKRLNQSHREICHLSRYKQQSGQSSESETDRLKHQLQEKESFILELIQKNSYNPEEPMMSSRPNENAHHISEGVCERDCKLHKDLESIKEELHLVLRKERQAQLDVSSLQSVLANQNEEMKIKLSDIETLSRTVQIKEELVKQLQRQIAEPSDLPVMEHLIMELEERLKASLKQGTKTPDNQDILEALVSEQVRLNDALKAEIQLYSSLVQLYTDSESSQKGQALQNELDAVQALRLQLEEFLARTRDGFLELEKTNRSQSDFGGHGTAEEEFDDSQSEFTDSIEDEESTNEKTYSPFFCQEVPIEKDAVRKDLSRGVIISERDMLELRSELQEVKKQKNTVEGELKELKMQLETAGYESLAQMRSMLLSLKMENDKLKSVVADVKGACEQKGNVERLSMKGLREECRKLKDNQESIETAEGLQHEQHQLKRQVCGDEVAASSKQLVDGAHEIQLIKGKQGELGPAQGKRSASGVQLRERGEKRRRGSRPFTLDLGDFITQNAIDSQQSSRGHFWEYVESSFHDETEQLRSELALSQQESQELKEKLLVSEATVEAQASQLKQYHTRLTETSVKQDSKQVQVDFQDLGYETCERSENEAEREEASSPDYEALDVHGRLFGLMDESHHPLSSGTFTSSLKACAGLQDDTVSCKDVPVLHQHIQDLRAQLQRSEKVIRNLQARLRSVSVTSDYASSLERPHKVTWDFEASPAQSGLEEDEGWQSDGVGIPIAQPNKELQELVSRVASLEAQLKTSRIEGKNGTAELKSAAWPGKYDSLIQAQARELSHLRQKMRESRGICHILSQHLGDTTKSFEELLRDNDIDYYMGQSFREQLAQNISLAERVSNKLSSRDRSEIDDKTGHELLALRLSKELQQKDKIIESLHAKLQQRVDTPTSSRALSETTDHSDRTSFLSDDHASTNDDLDGCSDVDAASEYTQEGQVCLESPVQSCTDSHSHSGTMPQNSSISSSSTAPNGAQHKTDPNMPCTKPDLSESSQAPKGFHSSPTSTTSTCTHAQCHPNPSGPSGQFGNLPFDPRSTPGNPAYQSTPFSLAEVHQELQMLQRQLGETSRHNIPHLKPLPHSTSFSEQPLAESSGFMPSSHHPYHQIQFGNNSNGKDGLIAEADLLNAAGVWDMSHLLRPTRNCHFGDVSSGSSGYQSGINHTGTDLIEEHLSEIRSLRQRLEDSICTNDRLRKQLEERLSSAGRDTGPPTNIYIQGLESASQLSNENRSLKEENLSLQAKLNQTSRESCAELKQLQEAVLSGRAELKQAQMETEQWRDESRRLQAQSCEQQQEIQQLRQDKQASHEQSNRLQHEVNLLQQQVTESRQLLHTLQSELQLYDRVYMSGGALSAYTGDGSYQGAVASSFELNELLRDTRNLRLQLEHSIQENSSLRQQLEQQLDLCSARNSVRPSSINISTPVETGCRRQLFQESVPSPPVRDTGLFNPVSPFSAFSKSSEFNVEHANVKASEDAVKHTSALEGDAPDGSFASKNGRHVIGHVDDFSALQQQILEGKMLVHRMESLLQSSLGSSFMSSNMSKDLNYSSITKLLGSTKTLRQVLEEATALLKMFWRAALPSTDSCMQHARKEQSMKAEIQKLKQKIAEQEGNLQNAIEKLKNTSRTKESMEHFIVSQLSRTRDVLKKARSNLELFQKNEYRISSSNSCSPYSADTTGVQAGNQGNWNFMNPHCHEPSRRKVGHRPTKKKEKNSQGLLQVVSY
ncbi:myomegalin isoform X1 [Polypterus senegalus]|uniref:myomegalin isoform X1 n=1 Tax=Polypterus senegalus TaxID=55291 RepID=UPI001964E7F1|nr:myomegalin isoform X1 [Polypterus senegalus]